MDEEGNFKSWEWDVNPETRQVGCWINPGPKRKWQGHVPKQDFEELHDFIQENDFVLHNTKFDCRALELMGLPRLRLSGCNDTLVASHCLVSNESHKLKDLCIRYLDIDDDDEKDLKEATNSARRIAKQLGWAIATGPHPHFPAEKFKGKKEEDQKWKYDTWVPRAVARYKWEVEGDKEYNPKTHPWWKVLRTYGLRDVERTMPLWQMYKDALEEEGLWPQYLERIKEIEALYVLDTWGVTISTKRLKKLNKELKTTGDEMHDKCLKLANYKIDNLASPKQLTGVLFGGQMGVKPIKLTDGGIKKAKLGQQRDTSDYSTKAEVLIEILDRIHPKNEQSYLPPRKRQVAYDFIWNLLGYRGRDKLQEYLEEYTLRGIQRGKDFIALQGSVNPTGSDTLRHTMSKPSLQVVSKGNQKRADDPIPGIRGVFGPMSGREWYSADFSNIELRIFSYESGDQDLINAYEQGYKVHCIFAKLLWEKEYKQCEKDSMPLATKIYKESVKAARRSLRSQQDDPHYIHLLRKQAEELFQDRYYETLYQWVKNGNFSLIYGAGKTRADNTYHRPGAYDLIRSRMPLIDEFMLAKKQESEVHGYITTLGGYRLWVPPSEPHVAVNYFVQGSAGWCMVLAINRCHAYLTRLNESLGLSDEACYKMIMTIHDELVFDFPIHKRNQQVITDIAKIMEGTGKDIGVPTPVEVSHHPDNWAEENKEFKLAI